MIKIKATLALILLSASTISFAEETPWEIAQDKKDKTAPALFSPEMETAGEGIYLKNCKSCHGDIGQMNMIPLDPLPKDLSIPQVSDQTDGSIYTKISEGRAAMPSFKNVLSISDTWSVIAYIRSFHEGYVQAQPSVIDAFAGSAVTLAMKFIEDEHLIQVIAMGKEDDQPVPAEGVEINLYAKRYFGQLKVGEAKPTNKDGIASFHIPENLRADSAGIVRFNAKVLDMEQYGEASAAGDFIAGKATYKPAINADRQMWNVVSKAPWWLTIAYPLVVLIVLSTIGYIVLSMYKVYMLGKEDNEQ